MKKLVIPLAIVAMLALLAVAFAWDSVRSANSARARVMLADGEVKKQELRLVKLLSDSGKSTDEVKAGLATYRSAGNALARLDAYDRLVGDFQKTMASQLDPTDPLDRKFSDEVVGAQNRRKVALTAYDDESAVYQKFLDGFRGRIAKMFSSQAMTAEAETP